MSGWGAIWPAVFAGRAVGYSKREVTWRYVFKSGDKRVQFDDFLLKDLEWEDGQLIYMGERWEYVERFPATQESNQ